MDIISVFFLVFFFFSFFFSLFFFFSTEIYQAAQSFPSFALQIGVPAARSRDARSDTYSTTIVIQ